MPKSRSMVHGKIIIKAKQIISVLPAIRNLCLRYTACRHTASYYEDRLNHAVFKG